MEIQKRDGRIHEAERPKKLSISTKTGLIRTISVIYAVLINGWGYFRYRYTSHFIKEFHLHLL